MVGATLAVAPTCGHPIYGHPTCGRPCMVSPTLCRLCYADNRLRLYQARAISRWQHRGIRSCTASHTAIDKADAIHLVWLVDIAPIDKHRAAHRAAYLEHVQRFELVPLRD